MWILMSSGYRKISTLASRTLFVPVLNQNHIYFELAIVIEENIETLSLGFNDSI